MYFDNTFDNTETYSCFVLKLRRLSTNGLTDVTHGMQPLLIF